MIDITRATLLLGRINASSGVQLFYSRNANVSTVNSPFTANPKIRTISVAFLTPKVPKSAKMSQLSRAAMKWSRLISTAQPNRRLPSAFFASPKLFSTEAAESSLGSSGDQFLQTPSSGSVYARVGSITRYTTKGDILNLLEGCGLNPENLKVEYNRSYTPLTMMVEFPSRSGYDAAFKEINRKGRTYGMKMANKSEWDVTAPFDGKAILLSGIPSHALIDDIERFLSGCQYYSSSIDISYKQTSEGFLRMAVVRFPSQALAMHACITKNGGYCLNGQVSVHVLH
ncbi:hypothetical protein PHJA_002235000 [Phtheirospermum japonicum]|uniref:Uncharacterized protein n=1 Tax=Phtheirospermum japonicum TaxID=374723 RepID=A0A830CM31_9LAMI|nr:hypothetical protein PHJA_002235000 [Phtheirospermum japonicum]